MSCGLLPHRRLTETGCCAGERESSRATDGRRLAIHAAAATTHDTQYILLLHPIMTFCSVTQYLVLYYITVHHIAHWLQYMQPVALTVHKCTLAAEWTPAGGVRAWEVCHHDDHLDEDLRWQLWEMRGSICALLARKKTLNCLWLVCRYGHWSLDCNILSILIQSGEPTVLKLR